MPLIAGIPRIYTVKDGIISCKFEYMEIYFLQTLQIHCIIIIRNRSPMGKLPEKPAG
ncbi:hypothetical protein CBFG_05679 [Clostridiales bacterium 1_7_47FAA]|nr:hypothetical protein CBFG_05679 [Clostridiales bacterium 1_7_47FAA]